MSIERIHDLSWVKLRNPTWVKKNECETLRPLQHEVEQMLMQKTGFLEDGKRAA